MSGAFNPDSCTLVSNNQGMKIWKCHHPECTPDCSCHNAWVDDTTAESILDNLESVTVVSTSMSPIATDSEEGSQVTATYTAPSCPEPVCAATGERVTNGGMELFTGTVPAGWTANDPARVSQTVTHGTVHSGTSAVELQNGAVLSQLISPVCDGCFYIFSFFAQGSGSQVGVIATVTYLLPEGSAPGGQVLVRQQDLGSGNRAFTYFEIFTTAAPNGVTGARLDFAVTAGGNQMLILDDVSFG